MTLSLESWSGSSNSSSAQKSARLMICELPSKAVSLVFRSPCEESPVGIPCLKGKPRGFLYHVVTMVVGSSRKRMYLKKEATQASRTELLKQKRNQLNHFESLWLTTWYLYHQRCFLGASAFFFVSWAVQKHIVGANSPSTSVFWVLVSAQWQLCMASNHPKDQPLRGQLHNWMHVRVHHSGSISSEWVQTTSKR